MHFAKSYTLILLIMLTEQTSYPHISRNLCWLLLLFLPFTLQHIIKPSDSSLTLGLPHLIAKTEDDYVRIAVKLASNVSSLSELRISLRELMLKSPLCDGLKFMKQLESSYRSMWHRYCRGDSPALRQMEASQREHHTHSDKITVIFSEAGRSTPTEEHRCLSTKANGLGFEASSSLSVTHTSPDKNIANGGLNWIGRGIVEVQSAVYLRAFSSAFRHEFESGFLPFLSSSWWVRASGGRD